MNLVYRSWRGYENLENLVSFKSKKIPASAGMTSGKNLILSLVIL
jgi:hypothetical protein